MHACVFSRALYVLINGSINPSTLECLEALAHNSSHTYMFAYVGMHMCVCVLLNLVSLQQIQMLRPAAGVEIPHRAV